MKELYQHEIKCPIFLDSEAIIKKIITKLAKTSFKERNFFTQDILTEVNALLSCGRFNRDCPECIKCRSISEQRRITFQSNTTTAQDAAVAVLD